MTQEDLKHWFSYDEDTGLFTRRRDVANGAFKAGTVAGSKHKESGYVRINFMGKLRRAHRMAWLYVTGEDPKDQIDHVNRVRDDNRFENLREACGNMNMKNQTVSDTNATRERGVYLSKNGKRFRARIGHLGKLVGLGTFDTIEEAVSARRVAEKELGYII